MKLRIVVAALAFALATPACAAFISATPPQPIPVYPGCPVPPVGPWLSTGSSATNQIWYIDPVNGNDANDGMTKATAWKTIASLTTSGVNPHPRLFSVDPVNGVVKGGDEVLLETGSYGSVSISPAVQANNSPEVTLAADGGAIPSLITLTISKTGGWVFRGLHVLNTAASPLGAITINSSAANNVNDIIFYGNDAANHTQDAFNGFFSNFTGSYDSATSILTVNSMLPASAPVTPGFQADWINIANGAPPNGVEIDAYGAGGTTGTGGVGTYRITNAVPLINVTSATWAANVITFNLASPLPVALASGISVTSSGFTPVGYNGTFTTNASALAGATTITVTQATNPGSSPASVDGTVQNMNDYPDGKGGPFIMSAMNEAFYVDSTDQVVRDIGGGNDNSASSCHSYYANRFHNAQFILTTTVDKLLIEGNEFDHWYKSMWESFLSNTTIEKNHFHDTASTIPNHPDEIQLLNNINTGPATFPNLVYRRNYYNEHEDPTMPFTNGSFGLVDGSKFRTPITNMEVSNNLWITSNFDTMNWSLTSCFTCTVANNTLIEVNAAAAQSPTNTHADITMTDVQFTTPTAATWSGGIATITDAVGAFGIPVGGTLFLHDWTPAGYNGTWTVAAPVNAGATAITLTMPSDPGGPATVMGGIGFQSTNVVVRNNIATTMALKMPEATPAVDHNTLAGCPGTGCVGNGLYQHQFSGEGSFITCSPGTLPGTCNDSSGNPTINILTQGSLNSASIWQTFDLSSLSFGLWPLSTASSVVAQGAPWDSTYTPTTDYRGFPWPNPPSLGASRCFNAIANAC